MKKIIIIALALVLLLTLGGTSVFAGIGNEIPDNGKHYNLNIIGVKNAKKVDMTDSNRHTIFVPLDKNGEVGPCKIYVVRNIDNPTEFQVLDGNACDNNGATIAVPYEDLGVLSYNVYATALGKPGGTAGVDAEVYFAPTDDYPYETYGNLLMTHFDLPRVKGNKGVQKPHPMNISDIFRATGYIDVDDSGAGGATTGDITFENVWVFNVPTLFQYLWNYDNDGLKLMQVRFYETTSGSWGIAP
ncbi:hypothetical protein ACFLUX_00700 [Chloroflexota bacterium]